MINQCAPVNCIARWEREADGFSYRTYEFASASAYKRAQAWLTLMGNDAPLPPPDGFQRAPDGVGWEVPANAIAGCIDDLGAVDGNDGGPLTITNKWGELRFGPLPRSLPLPRLPSIPNLPSIGDMGESWFDVCEQPEAQNIYCVRNHTGMSDCCPDCGTDPEQRRATAFHNGEETEGCYIACPKGCQTTGPFPRAEQAWGQWHAKCRQRHGA